MAYALQEFTIEIGEQTMVPVSHNHDVTVVITAGTSDDVDLEFQLAPDGTRHKLRTGIKGTTVVTLEGPVSAVGIDIDVNVSNAISMEVRSAHRGG